MKVRRAFKIFRTIRNDKVLLLSGQSRAHPALHIPSAVLVIASEKKWELLFKHRAAKMDRGVE